MKTSKKSFEQGDFVELNFEGIITKHDPHSDYPYTVTFTTADSSENLKGWTLQMNGSNMKPMNFGAYPWRLRYMAIYSLVVGFLLCATIIAVAKGLWISLIADVIIMTVFILVIISDLNYLKKHYEEIY